MRLEGRSKIKGTRFGLCSLNVTLVKSGTSPCHLHVMARSVYLECHILVNQCLDNLHPQNLNTPVRVKPGVRNITI